MPHKVSIFQANPNALPRVYTTLSDGSLFADAKDEAAFRGVGIHRLNLPEELPRALLNFVKRSLP